MSNMSMSQFYSEIMAQAQMDNLHAIDLEKRYLGKSLLEQLDKYKFYVSKKRDEFKSCVENKDSVKERIKTNWQKLISPITDFFGLFKPKKK